MLNLKGLLAAAFLTVTGAAQGVPATGFITVKQVDGRWWFVDGQGQKFFSVGADCVEGCYGHYEEKPLPAAHKARALTLMRDWHFNSAGGWSSPSLWDSLYFADQIYPPVSVESDDLFDPALWARFDQDILRELKPFLKQPKFLGYFLSNEPAWPGEALFNQYRALKPGTPGSLALIKFAQAYYEGDLARLNREWGTSFHAFEAIAASTKPDKPTELMQEKFFKAWRIAVAANFYKHYAEVVRRHDPDHLILGIRAAGVDPDFLKAISAPFDVISANVYDRFGELPQQFADISQATGKPCMITEWSFSSYPVAGAKSLQYIEVFSEAAKGLGYTKFIKAMASAPFMVGSHWFLYEDYDADMVMRGPYYPDEAMGLVTAHDDKPHQEFGRWVKKANEQVKAWHAGSRWSPLPTPTPQAVDLPIFTPAVDGKLDEWARQAPLQAWIGHSLHPNLKVKDRYYLARDAKFFYAAGEVFDDHIDAGENGWNWECDYLGLKLSPPEREDGLDHQSYFAILPTGGGDPKGIGPDPYIYPWSSAKGSQAMAGAMVKRLYTSTGFTFEAAIPLAAILDYGGKKNGLWDGVLFYHNSGGVYETHAAYKFRMGDK